MVARQPRGLFATPKRCILGAGRVRNQVEVRDRLEVGEMVSLWGIGGPSRCQAIFVAMTMLAKRVRRFLSEQRVAHLATADRRAIPHVVPVCFAVHLDTLYITIDEKPKRLPAARLKRLKNISENPEVAIVVDRYEENWTRLAWVMLYGRADVLTHGQEHADAQALLTARYPQLASMRITQHPVIAVRIERVTSWGDLA
jgi:PPOX class probable F420-dependent enzyme